MSKLLHTVPSTCSVLVLTHSSPLSMCGQKTSTQMKLQDFKKIQDSTLLFLKVCEVIMDPSLNQKEKESDFCHHTYTCTEYVLIEAHALIC